MFWEILAWAGVALIYAFRIALVVAIVAVVFLVARALTAAKSPVRHAGVPGRR
jgi:hypothetical protein